MNKLESLRKEYDRGAWGENEYFILLAYCAENHDAEAIFASVPTELKEEFKSWVTSMPSGKIEVVGLWGPIKEEWIDKLRNYLTTCE